jgi:hypothetical protein
MKWMAKNHIQLGGCLYGWAWRLILWIFCRLNLKNLGVRRMENLSMKCRLKSHKRRKEAVKGNPEKGVMPSQGCFCDKS